MTAEAGPGAIRRALISVSDKAGLIPLARALADRGIEILSTGGTARDLRAEGLAVVEVSDITGVPEMMDGRVKTLHPAIHGGLLALRDDAAHLAAMAEHAIRPIDLLVVNLYPFEAGVAEGASGARAVELIDVGGPAMIRAGAKNHAHVTVIVDPEDYPALLAELDTQGGATSAAFRARAAQTAFARTAAYDIAVSSWLAREHAIAVPRRRGFAGQLALSLRYGENPHQSAAFYRDASPGPSIATAVQVQGKELSYNNIADADAALALAAEFTEGPACVIVKHANPCGVALGPTLRQAWQAAHDCDRTSAFGGIVAVNRPLDAAVAEAIAGIFTEVVVAPGADAAAREILAARPNLRLLLLPAMPAPGGGGPVVRTVSGGFLVQDPDDRPLRPADLRVVTRRHPTAAQTADLHFAWKVAKHVKSNAIVFARDGATVGIGAGQMSRVDSTRIAVRKAAEMGAALGLGRSPAEGAVVASDAFFPFADGIEALAAAGAAAVIQPGGSLRDAEVIAAADAAGLSMILTGVRHFRH